MFVFRASAVDFELNFLSTQQTARVKESQRKVAIELRWKIISICKLSFLVKHRWVFLFFLSRDSIKFMRAVKTTLDGGMSISHSNTRFAKSFYSQLSCLWKKLSSCKKLLSGKCSGKVHFRASAWIWSMKQWRRLSWEDSGRDVENLSLFLCGCQAVSSCITFATWYCLMCTSLGKVFKLNMRQHLPSGCKFSL